MSEVRISYFTLTFCHDYVGQYRPKSSGQQYSRTVPYSTPKPPKARNLCVAAKVPSRYFVPVTHVTRWATQYEIRRIQRIRDAATELRLDVSVRNWEMVDLPSLAWFSCQTFSAVMALSSTAVVYQLLQRLRPFFSGHAFRI